MKIVFLCNYPLVDNRKWRQELIAHLAAQHDVTVIFGRKSLWAHARAYLERRRSVDVKKRLAYGGPRTTRFLRERGVPCFRTHDLNDPQTLAILRRIRPDFGVAALDQIVRKPIIEAIPILLNVHYGDLPDVRGLNATEWTLLVKRRLAVTLHRIVPKVDAGEIYAKQPIRVERNDDLETLRLKCQEAAKDLYIRFFDDTEGFIGNALPSAEDTAPSGEDTGRQYYLMNAQLRRLVERMLPRIGAEQDSASSC